MEAPRSAMWRLVVVADQSCRERALTPVGASPEVMMGSLTDKQYALLELVGMTREHGALHASISDALDLDATFIHNDLQKLTKLGAITKFMVEAKGRERKSKLPPQLELSHAFWLHKFSGTAGPHVKWVVSAEELCTKLALCRQKTAVAAEIKTHLHGATITSASYDSMVLNLVKRNYVEHFQVKVDGKLKRCIRLLKPFPTVAYQAEEARDVFEQSFTIIAASGHAGIALDEVMTKLGLYMAQGRAIMGALVQQTGINPVIAGIESSWDYQTVFRLGVSDANTGAGKKGKAGSIGITGRVKSMKDQADRRIRLMKKLLADQHVMQNDIDCRAKFQEMESLELGDGACMTDRKTMARLIGKLIASNDCKEITVAITLASGSTKKVTLVVEPALSEQSMEVQQMIGHLKEVMSASRNLKVKKLKEGGPEANDIERINLSHCHTSEKGGLPA